MDGQPRRQISFINLRERRASPKSLSAMEICTGFCPGLHLALVVWLVIAGHSFQNTQAEISCASCRSPLLLHGGQPTNDLSAINKIHVKFRELGISRQHAGMENDQEDAPYSKKGATGSATESHRGGETGWGDGATLPRAKRNIPEFAELDGLGSSGLSKSEIRKNKDDGRGHKQQDEPKITSSTFALSGDSAHNHAVVYWSGQNSSVILILTKLYDFHIGSVTESTLWRSSDSGSTYEKMDDKIGSKTILSYLYVCPTNKKKIMVLTDPEFESSVLISSDEGASYQKYRLTFYILSLLFHPTEEDWALAYSHDQKVYSSLDFGRKWQLVHEHVTPTRFYWSVSGVDKEPDLVHMEAHTPDGSVQYITCRVHKCTEANKNYPFPGSIDISSLVVQDDYIFIQVPTSGRATYYVSYKREVFIQIKLPKYSLPKDLHIVSTDEKQVFAAVQEWNQNDTYNLYLSDTRGIYFTLAMENVKTTKGIGGNHLLGLYEVSGIRGMLIANKRQEKQVKTFITYNKGRDWRLLQAPTTDLDGNEIHCVLPFCSLHLQLQTSDNPYLSGAISTKSSAPGIILATGNIGTELSYNNVGMYISSDAGNTWRQIFEEEHNVWFLDQGGALVAVKQPSVSTRHLWVSFDEGRQWTQHSFSSIPLFVDGILVEAGAQNQIMTLFGHFSHRSEWQLIKIDYKSIFSKKCTEEDYQTWHLHNQGEPCVMGQKQIYMKRRPGNNCMLGKDDSRVLSAESCICRAHDFECDYGYERSDNGNCKPSFWFNPSLATRSCSLGHNYFNSTGYRKVVLNNCTKGVKEMYPPRKQQCPKKPPKGLLLTTKDGKLAANLGTNVTFLVHLDEGDSLRTNIQLDFGDGIAVSYSNLSWAEEGIKHVYKSAGIFCVTALAENSLGYDTATLYLHVTCPVELVQLLAPFVVIRNKEVNISAVVLPSHPRTITYFWWLGNTTESLVTLDRSISYTFANEGMYSLTVQVAAANTIFQDSKTIAVREFFKSLLLSFSPNLDEFNPDLSEWRQDLGRVIKKAILQVAKFPEEQLLVAVFPGVPTAAELFLLPHKSQSHDKKKSEEELQQVSNIIVNALNQNLVAFELKPGVRVIVYNTQLTLAPLVDSNHRHRSSAMLMLLSVVFLGLAVFLIYKFKRKIPWISIYAEVNQDKEQEMITSVDQGDNTAKITLNEFSSSKKLVEKEVDARVKRGVANAHESTREIPNCTSV
ncbi:VPS10 domain-containing receptor SorCS3 isoform X2 [Syngnathoides biaculeatus]|uniref:VPS10 domain-containing receptor SorCS3 isoform X2 n=1 Tax=Syngnathoides biaculeatus TaxID=300417 RepID=UPI002ADE267C|nr:VPS10 domain-containing receptor SorCS3 isoform X2 [Syngnathoides biaculeatus]